MLTQTERQEVKAKVLLMLNQAGIAVTDAEAREMEIAEYGMNRWAEIGLQILVYVNTERCCAKELVLFSNQICPEHRHPPMPGSPGKEETFRCRSGEVYLYVPGEKSSDPKGKVPTDKVPFFTVWHEIVLRPGEQYTLMPDTLHWFQAGPEGAIVSEFSTRSHDETDVFTDPEIVRVPDNILLGQEDIREDFA
ncbi:MAG: D-lyxose/D-mannose family sugar isomerase [Oscillospiraceae bacterium]|nr:D-lyxose/D-mannose family sugar isomerase [Oscillospiraceae bacterium]